MSHNGRNDRCKAAPIRELRVQHGVVFVEFLTKLIGNHFESGAELAGVERNSSFPVHDPVTFGPPGCVRIAHDFADAFVQQQRLNRPKEWKDQLEAHSENLTAMEAQQSAGLPRVKSNVYAAASSWAASSCS